MNKPPRAPGFRQTATREMALFTGFLFFGLAIMPIVIYQVGGAVFGTYGGIGYGDFYATLSAKIRHWDVVAWFLVLSPYLGWQVLRLAVLGWKAAGRATQTS